MGIRYGMLIYIISVIGSEDKVELSLDDVIFVLIQFDYLRWVFTLFTFGYWTHILIKNSRG